MPEWDVFTVYGSFKEPTSGHNFIVVRMSTGRLPWVKKIVPAIRAIVRDWPGYDRRQFYVMGEDPEVWETRAVPRYEWDGSRLVHVPHHDVPAT